MSRIAFMAAATSALLLQQGPAHSGIPYKIVTANTTGTYYAIGSDLAKIVAPGANIDLEVVPTSGSAENVKLLRHEPGAPTPTFRLRGGPLVPALATATCVVLLAGAGVKAAEWRFAAQLLAAGGVVYVSWRLGERWWKRRAAGEPPSPP